ncbi:MAG: oligosaccharide flippase family protein [Oscillospiraceae bacterium]|nr:oligosaccharide flippase family protein [Oscillospiraceae bacterium]
MKVNQLKVGVMLSYMSMFISTIISVLYTPVMLRLLGQSEYGLYQLVFSVVSYLGLLSFGFGSAYMRFYSRYKVQDNKEGIARLNGMFMTIFLIIAGITLVAGSVLVANVELIFKGGLTEREISTARILMILMVFNIAISFPASVFDSNVTAHEQYFFQRIVSLARSVLNPFLTLPLLLFGFKSISLVVITTLLTLVSLGVNMWFCFKKLKVKFTFKHFEYKLLKEIWIFSFFIFINLITDQINWSVDKLILGKFVGTVGVAVYSIGSQFNTYYLSFSSSVSSVFIPRVNKIVASSDDNKVLTELFTRVGRIQYIVLSFILCGFIILGQYFISIWAGSGYKVSYFVALWLMVPVTIPLIQNLGIEIQRAKNMHKFRSIVYLLIAVVNIFISIPLAKSYGEVGAAAGTSISLFIGNGLVMNWYYQKRVGLDMAYFWKEILKFTPAVAVPLLLGLIVKSAFVINSVGMFLTVSVGYCLVFCLCMWFFGMNSYEKDLFSGPLMKIKSRLFKKGTM